MGSPGLISKLYLLKERPLRVQNQRSNSPINAHLRSGTRDLSWPCHKMGQGHPRVMIYTTFIKLYCLLHAKFQNYRPSGSGEKDFLKVFAICSHGSHLGLVTLTFYINFHSPFLTMLHLKFRFYWYSGFREIDV